MRDALELRGSHLLDGREHGGHRIVDPDVDGTELLFHLLRRILHLLASATSVGRTKGFAAHRLDLAPRSFQAILAAGDQADPRAMPGKLANRGASNSGGRARDDYDFMLSSSSFTLLHQFANFVRGYREGDLAAVGLAAGQRLGEIAAPGPP